MRQRASASAGVVQGWPPAVPATTPRRSVVPATSAATVSASTSAASTNTDSVRSRLAPCSAKPLDVSQAAAQTASRARARSPASASASWPTPNPGAAPATGTSRIAAPSRGRDEHRGEPVDERRPLDVDAALTPQPAELAVRLQRPRPAPTLQARLGLLREADQERRERDAADDLHRPADSRLRRHPIAPIRTARSSTTTRPIRYATYVPSRPLCSRRAHEAATSAPSVTGR